jgi:hypothetical protein
LVVALDCDIDLFTYWDYTFNEIITLIASYRRKAKDKREEQSMQFYRLADLMGVSAGRLVSKECVYPSFEEAYPEFSNNPISEKDSIESQKRNNAAIIKSQIIAFEQYQKSQRGNK